MDTVIETVTDRDFKDAMGRFLTGVTIVSIMREDGSAYGLTVNSFASVSLKPRLVLWSLIKTNTHADAFAKAERFSIAMLSHDQEALCTRFASDVDDRFDGVSWHKSENDLPILDGALTVLECQSFAQYDGGDHIIFIGEIIAIHQGQNDQKPMSYYSGKVNQI